MIHASQCLTLILMLGYAVWVSLKRVLQGFLFLLAIGGSISLLRSTIAQGSDYFVFWRAGRAILDRTPLYVFDGVGGMIFKYPPWIALLFTPFALFPFEISAKVVWGLFELLSLYALFYGVKRLYQVQWTALITLAFLYWGIWVVHALDGQIAIPLLSMALISLALPQQNYKIDVLNGFLLTSKIFTLFPLLFQFKRYCNRQVILGLVLMSAVGSVVVAERTSSLPTFAGRIEQVMAGWKEAAGSGSKYLPAGHTRGRKNHSLATFTCRLLEVPAENTQIEVGMSLLFYFIFTVFLFLPSLKFSLQEKALLAFALTPVAHPLPWLHLFAWTFPLAVVVLDLFLKKIKTHQKPSILTTILVVTSLVMITLGSERVFGRFGDWLEWHAAKGFGTVLLVWAYGLLRRDSSSFNEVVKS